MAPCLLMVLAGTPGGSSVFYLLLSTWPNHCSARPPSAGECRHGNRQSVAQETRYWAKTGRKRHWAASAGADKAEVSGRVPVREERRKCQNHIGGGASTRNDPWADRMAGRCACRPWLSCMCYWFVCPHPAFWISIAITSANPTVIREEEKWKWF